MKKPSLNAVLFFALAAMIGLWATPTRANKNAVPLRLGTPVESPNAVWFSWSGGDGETSYSLYRRLRGYTWWERIAMNLQGESGSVSVTGFTLDRDFDYELRAEQ